MFQTNDAHKSPLTRLFSQYGESYWTAAEMSLKIPWFLIEIQESEADGEGGVITFGRTLFLTRIEDMENLLKSQDPAGSVVKAVYAVTPATSMDPKAGAWIVWTRS